jgi:uncharacterized membrane protein (DUF106 family)
MSAVELIPTAIPWSTLFIFLLATGVSLLTSVTNRLLTDPQKSKAWRKEISEWNSELRKAQREGDKKQLDKTMKKQKQILQLQSKMTWQQMKVSLIFIIPLFIIWQVLGTTFAQHPDIAYFPGVGPNLPLPLFSTSLIWWYLLCSMLVGTIFSHLLRIMEISE